MAMKLFSTISYTAFQCLPLFPSLRKIERGREVAIARKGKNVRLLVGHVCGVEIFDVVSKKRLLSRR